RIKYKSPRIPRIMHYNLAGNLRRLPMELNTLYLICAIAGGTILILRLILMIIGLDHGDAPDVDVSVDADIDGDVHADIGEGGNGINFFSLQGIAGFFTMFGLVGMGLLQLNVLRI